MRIILGNKYSTYEEALDILNLETLYERRSMLCKKFAQKCIKNEKNEGYVP